MILTYAQKEGILDRARNLKFFSRGLKQIYSATDYSKGGGLFKWIQAEEDFAFEEELVKKMKLIKSICGKYGDSAINRYQELTEQPDKTHHAYDDFQKLKHFGIDWIDELFIPMKKEEFEIYLDVYNQVFKDFN